MLWLRLAEEEEGFCKRKLKLISLIINVLAAVCTCAPALYLIVVHGDVKFIVQFQSQAPDDPPEPQAVVAVHWLRLRRNVQDVFALVQGTHVLTCPRDAGPGRWGKMSSIITVTKKIKQCRVTSVCDQEDGVFIQSLGSLQAHFIAELLDDVCSHLGVKSCHSSDSSCFASYLQSGWSTTQSNFIFGYRHVFVQLVLVVRHWLTEHVLIFRCLSIPPGSRNSCLLELRPACVQTANQDDMSLEDKHTRVWRETYSVGCTFLSRRVDNRRALLC